MKMAAPFAFVAGRLVCLSCRAAADAARGQVLVVHAHGCALLGVLLEAEASNKPLVVYDGAQALRVFSAAQGTVS